MKRAGPWVASKPAALVMSTWSAGHAVAYGPGEKDEDEDEDEDDEVVASATRGGVVQPTDRIGVSSCDVEDGNESCNGGGVR